MSLYDYIKTGVVSQNDSSDLELPIDSWKELSKENPPENEPILAACTYFDNYYFKDKWIFDIVKLKNNEWFYWPPKNKFNYENGKYVKWLLPKECKFVFWTTVIDKKNLCDSKHDWLYKMWLAHYLNSYRVDENPLMPLSAKPEEE